jgi:hypothetical protein
MIIITIYTYILKYVIKEINLLFLKCVQVFHNKSKEKGRKGNDLFSSQARSSTSADLFEVMVLLNFYLLVLINYYFAALFDMFYHYFCL